MPIEEEARIAWFVALLLVMLSFIVVECWLMYNVVVRLLYCLLVDWILFLLLLLTTDLTCNFLPPALFRVDDDGFGRPTTQSLFWDIRQHVKVWIHLFCPFTLTAKKSRYTREKIKMGFTLLIDNYDSFTWNIYADLASVGGNPYVVRNDKITLKEIEVCLFLYPIVRSTG